MTHLVAAVISGLVTTAASSPIDVIKTRVMTEVSRGAMFNGPVDCIVKSIKAEGVAVLYRGFMPNYMRIGARGLCLHASPRTSITNPTAHAVSSPLPPPRAVQGRTLSWCVACAARTRGGTPQWAAPHAATAARAVLPPAGVPAQPVWRRLYVGGHATSVSVWAPRGTLMGQTTRSPAPLLPSLWSQCRDCAVRDSRCAPRTHTFRQRAEGKGDGLPQLRFAAQMRAGLPQAPHDHAPAAPAFLLAQMEGLWSFPVEAGPPRPAPDRLDHTGARRSGAARTRRGPSHRPPRCRFPAPQIAYINTQDADYTRAAHRLWRFLYFPKDADATMCAQWLRSRGAEAPAARPTPLTPSPAHQADRGRVYAGRDGGHSSPLPPQLFRCQQRLHRRVRVPQRRGAAAGPRVAPAAAAN